MWCKNCGATAKGDYSKLLDEIGIIKAKGDYNQKRGGAKGTRPTSSPKDKAAKGEEQ